MYRQAKSPTGALIRSIWCASAWFVTGLATASAGEFEWRMHTQFSVMEAGVVEGDFNPDNRLAALAERTGRLDLRPDLFAGGERWQVMLRPRAVVRRDRVSQAGVSHTDTDTDLFINEGRLRVSLTPGVDVSVGREHLLWGPGSAVMASNPFSPETGRDNPFLEVGGRDFVRMNWLHGAWTVSAIANVDEGRDQRRPDLPPLAGVDDSLDFKSIYALKIDHVGYAHQASVLLAGESGGPLQLGGFIDWIAGMGTRVYAEARVVRDIMTFDPVRDDDLPTGWGFRRVREQDSSPGGIWLAGVAHTLPQGTTLRLEGIHNRDGYRREQANELLDMASELAAQLQNPDPQVAGEAAGLLGLAASPGTPLLRRNYLFGQLDHRGHGGRTRVVLRYLHNLDDDGGRSTLVGEWDPWSQVGLFVLGVHNQGDPAQTELARYQRWLGMTGMRIYF